MAPRWHLNTSYLEQLQQPTQFYALTLYEQDVELIQKGGKIILGS